MVQLARLTSTACLVDVLLCVEFCACYSIMNSLAVLISIHIVCVFVLGADEVASIVYDAVLLLSEHRVVICSNGLIPSKVIAL